MHIEQQPNGASEPSLQKIISELQPHVEKLAREHGLTFFPVIFEPVTAKELTIIAAREGFPVRYSHWRFAQNFQELWKGYDYGTQKIYELVINNDPAVAYLMKSNSLVEQKLVMAHVYGHVDFFKNNLYFARTNRQMLNRMGDHAAIIRNVMDEHGREKVERWIDVCRSVDNLIGAFPRQIEAIRPISDVLAGDSKYPKESVRDVMKFMIEHAPLESWQRQIMEIVRDEAVYFQPQAQTKIMNEGWASYWHTKLMEQDLVGSNEVVHYCCTHAGAAGGKPGQINPYKLGLELYKDIEDRWNRGCFGADYEACGNYEQKLSWDKKLGLGREKIFEVRATHNDSSFLREFFTFEFARKYDYLPTVTEDGEEISYEEQHQIFKSMKDKLLSSLTNRGDPVISIEDANYSGSGELLLVHNHIGEDLQLAKAEPTLENLYQIWQKPVHIRTVLEGKKTLLAYNGYRQDRRELL